MGLESLTKEQKNYVVLAVIGAVILVVVVGYGIKWSLSSLGVVKEEVEDLSAKIERAEKSLDGREKVSKDYAQSIAKLRGYVNITPPEKNYYSWATEIIYSHARSSGIEVDSVDELEFPEVPKKEDQVVLEAYSLRVSVKGSYETIKSFLRLIHDGQRTIRVTGFNISSTAMPEVHSAQIFLQWPFNMGQLEKNWKKVESQKGLIRKKEKISLKSTSESEIISSDNNSVNAQKTASRNV